MLQKARAKKAPKPIPSVTYYCFKCNAHSPALSKPVSLSKAGQGKRLVYNRQQELRKRVWTASSLLKTLHKLLCFNS